MATKDRLHLYPSLASVNERREAAGEEPLNLDTLDWAFRCDRFSYTNDEGLKERTAATMVMNSDFRNGWLLLDNGLIEILELSQGDIETIMRTEPADSCKMFGGRTWKRLR